MKRTLLTLSALILSVMLGGCTSASDMTTATQQPTSTATVTASPDANTVLPGTTNGMDGMAGDNGTDGTLPSSTVIPESTGVTSMDKARRAIEQIEDELERLSEVEDAEVVIAGNKAAVGLTFDDQYRAGLDERLRKIVKERIDGVISGISTVAITADEGVTAAIESLGNRLDTMSDMTTLQSDLDAIIKKIQGMNA
ncbi:MAG: YhcN/YlaJ family sporulation lipoprotein [Clostridiales bacterium]|nr:YhcN/YlaJ family sporulation lipoprotein [Clostridiales bacterium]